LHNICFNGSAATWYWIVSSNQRLYVLSRYMRSPREVIRRRTNPPRASACRECSSLRIETLMFNRRDIAFGMRVTAGRSQLQKDSFFCCNYLKSSIHTTEAQGDVILGSSSPLTQELNGKLGPCEHQCWVSKGISR